MSGWPSLVRRWTANPMIPWISRVQIPSPAFILIINFFNLLKLNFSLKIFIPEAAYSFPMEFLDSVAETMIKFPEN